MTQPSWQKAKFRRNRFAMRIQDPETKEWHMLDVSTLKSTPKGLMLSSPQRARIPGSMSLSDTINKHMEVDGFRRLELWIMSEGLSPIYQRFTLDVWSTVVDLPFDLRRNDASLAEHRTLLSNVAYQSHPIVEAAELPEDLQAWTRENIMPRAPGYYTGYLHTDDTKQIDGNVFPLVVSALPAYGGVEFTVTLDLGGIRLPSTGVPALDDAMAEAFGTQALWRLEGPDLNDLVKGAIKLVMSKTGRLIAGFQATGGPDVHVQVGGV